MESVTDRRFDEVHTGVADMSETASRRSQVPGYLAKHYWWAYVHPKAVSFFERQWLINAILWGNYRRLKEATQAALGPDYSGRTLQVACAYGDFTPTLLTHVGAQGGRLDVIDVVPAQIENLESKLAPGAPLRTHVMDASRLDFPDGRFDRSVLFFLLHEQPEEVRRRTIAETLRVTKPGGKVVVMEYAKPRWWSPWRLLMIPVLTVLEPFAIDMWRTPVVDFAPPATKATSPVRFFGGLYQLVTLTRD
mgnify:CR=1 FL=1